MAGSVLEKKKCVLLLGASQDQLFIIRSAHEMGLETAVIDGNREAPGLAMATYSAPVDFSNTDAVVDYVNGLKKNGVDVCGVCVMGSDVPDIVARIAERFDWAGPSIQTGRWATDKYEMKCRFAEKGIAIPNFALVRSAEDISSLWDKWNCQNVIIKPTDRAGSRGVRLLSRNDDLHQAYEYSRSLSKKGGVILEEYLPGLQISTESIFTEIHAMTPGFADRVYEGMDVFWPQIMENGGWVPSILSEREKESVSDLVERAARALGITRGVAKGDVVIHPEKGPMMIEMAARLSGGDFSESLVPLGIGVNYVKAALKIAMGEEPDWDEMRPKWNKAVANRYFFLPSGRLEEIDGIERVKAMPSVKKFSLFYNQGDAIPEINHHGQRVGVAVVVDNNRDRVQSHIDEIYGTLRFKVNGRWMSPAPESKVFWG
ncbi:MAG: ATP-grasp domain-containing protein [Candidatus Omnitrophota bacterium]